ncbi:hypothetical protein Forpe1208_v014982 [Fusarium oxysporum f. sp. rapae]|uniref:Uncharacterized protein n=1 Tax=Fusarium oxysporum f. sp. rapae TaxID=485398 RepID=A0A8J5NI63_FUSOX|nr:hypothetical protein Forpe1208_v014982 [Fusarium oxysporum f. sp. rapae]
MMHRMKERPGWEDPSMQAMLQRFIDAFNDIKKDMSPGLADDLAFFCHENLLEMTQTTAMDISLCQIYQALESAISFPEWVLPRLYFPSRPREIPHLPGLKQGEKIVALEEENKVQRKSFGNKIEQVKNSLNDKIK